MKSSMSLQFNYCQPNKHAFFLCFSFRMAMQMNHSSEVDDLKKRLESEVKRLNDNWQERFEQVKPAIVNGDVNLKEDYEAKILTLKQESSLDREAAVMRERENLLAEHAIAIKSLKSEWEIELKRWQFDVEELKRNLTICSEERDTLEMKLKEITKQKCDMETKVNEYCDTIEKQRQEFTYRLENEHKDLRAEFEAMLENISSKLEVPFVLNLFFLYISFTNFYSFRWKLS